jgi:general secretion pathway protein D
MQTLNKILLVSVLFFGNVNLIFSQELFILNYEDVDIKKVTQDIAQFAKKNNNLRS